MLWIEYQVNGHRFAIEAKRVEAVLPGRLLASDPAPPPSPYGAGWMRFRNRLCPVLDLGAWWLGRPIPRRPNLRVLLARVAEAADPMRWAGLLVERVWGVTRRRPEEFLPLQPGPSGLPVATRVVLDERGLLHWVPWEEHWPDWLELEPRSIPAAWSDLGLPMQIGPTPAQGGDGTALGEPGPLGAGELKPAESVDPLQRSNCWRREGTLGMATCPQLERVRCCQSCETFQAAAARVLDWFALETDLGGFGAWLEKHPRPTTGRLEGLVVFGLQDHWWGIPTRWVEEVAGPLPFHRLPRRQESAVGGLVQWRGRLVPCVSLRRLLGWKESGPGWGTMGPWVILARESRGVLALPVDRLAGVRRVRTAELRPVPVLRADWPVDLACAMFHDGNRWVRVLDWDRTLSVLASQWAQKS
jgi:chemotaxis-related protein WspD